MDVHDLTKNTDIGNNLQINIPFNQPVIGSDEVNAVNPRPI